MSWLKQNWFKMIVGFGVVIIAFVFFYYFVIFLPQKEKARIEQQEFEELIKQREGEEAERKANLSEDLLNSCLDSADESAISQFYVICISDNSIGGSRDKCLSDDNQTAFEYMNASKFYYPVFEDILNKREGDRKECLSKYK